VTGSPEAEDGVVTARKQVCAKTSLRKNAEVASGLATKRAREYATSTAMVERLIQLGRVEPDFDLMTWCQGIRSYKGSQQQKRVHNLGKGITAEKDWKDAMKAQKLTPAYILHMKHKPKKAPKSFHDKTAQLMVDHISSTTYTSQATEEVTTPAQAEKAEGNRLLTYLYFSTSKWISENTGQGKDAKAPEPAQMPENPTDDEE
jgi:hypothetical protein